MLDGTELDAVASVEVEELGLLRDEQKFETEAVLRAQIAQDVAWAREQGSDV